MNYKIIIAIIAGIVVLLAVWLYQNAPSKAVRPVAALQQQNQQQPHIEMMVAQIASEIHCPMECCDGKDVSVAESTCQPSAEIRQSIRMLVEAGLSRQGVMAHLQMLGIETPETTLPEGHPPIDTSARG